MTCSWYLAPAGGKGHRGSWNGSQAFPLPTWLSFCAWGVAFPSSSRAVLLSHRSMWPHIPLSVAFLLELGHISQPRVEALAGMLAKSFTSVRLALSKTSLRAQDFCHLTFWSLNSHVGTFAFKMYFACSNMFLSAPAFTCPSFKTCFYGTLKIYMSLLLFFLSWMTINLTTWK